MLEKAVARGAIVSIAAALVLAAASSFANEAAQRMAEKFVEPSPAGAAGSPADPKADAAAAKRKAEQSSKEAQRKAEAARKAAQAKREAAAKAADARRMAELLKADEMDMLARARLEAEEMRAAAEEERLTQEARRLIELAAQERAKAEELLAGHGGTTDLPDGKAPIADSTPPQQPEPTDAAAAAPTLPKATAEEALAQRRAEEARRLAEKLQRVRQIRESRLARDAQRQQDQPKAPDTTPEAPPSLAAGGPPAGVGAPDRPQTAQTTSDPQAAPSDKSGVERPSPTPSAAEPAGAVPSGAVAAAPASPAAPDSRPEPRPAAPPSEEKVAVAPPRLPSRESGGSEAAGRPEAPPASSEPEPRSGLGAASTAPRAVDRAGSNGRVTVLLMMEPGNYGIRRRGPKVADPVLCMHEGCYVSAGADRPAMFLPGRKALGLGNTFGKRAGACRQSLTCVFRNVDLGTLPGYLQPVDLHILKHDLRQGHAILADSRCRMDSGRLLCRHGIEAADYTMWVVPEYVASEAGPEALQRALSERLDAPRSAALAPSPYR